MNINEEVIKRYSYLYENKELILAMCIDIKEINISNRKHELEVIKRKYQKLSADENIINNIDNAINNIKENTYIYYLSKDINEDIINSYEEFLFGDVQIEETSLYKHIGAVKNNKLYLESFNSMIFLLEESRQKNMYLKELPTFTVWKILSYVRRKNINNKVILSALDKYYNLDKYMITGYDSQSGYYINEEEYDKNTILYIKKYCEEDYFYDNEINYDSYNENYAISGFMVLMNDNSFIDIDMKRELYKKYNFDNKKLIRR